MENYIYNTSFQKNNFSQRKQGERGNIENPGEKKNPTTVCFGTFEFLHKGQKDFLDKLTLLSKNLLVCIDLAEGTSTQTLEARVRQLEKHLSGKNIAFQIIPIKDNYYKTIESYPSLQLIATGEDDSFGKEQIGELNSLRQEAGLAPLMRIEIPLTYGENKLPLTSSNIRQGLLDSEGKIPKETKKLVKTGHKIRDNIAEILLGEEAPIYGYEINKKYNRRYGKLSLRLTYYHLGKGVTEGIFKIIEKKKIEGGFSWGGVSERIYYVLGDGKLL